MASATAKRSPGTAAKKKDFHRAPRVEWTEEDRRAVIVAGRSIQKKEHLHVRECLDRAMRSALPAPKWRDVKKWEFPRIQWFIEAISAKEEPGMEQTSRRIITWTDEEKAELIVAGREIRKKYPDLGVRGVMVMAQEEVLPPERHRTSLRSAPPHQLEWFVQSVDGGGLQELPPVHKPELVELPPVKSLALPVGKKKQKVYWSPHDLELILGAARGIRDQTGLTNERRLIDRAQREVLPPEKWRDRTTMGGGVVNYLRDKIRSWPRLRVEQPPAEPEADPRLAESVRLALFDYAYPLPPPPEPVDVGEIVSQAVDAAVAEAQAGGIVRSGTEDLLAEMARRAYVSFTDWMGVVSSGFAALQSLQTAQNRDHDLLLKLAAEWDPKLLAESPKAEVNGQPPATPPPVVVPEPVVPKAKLRGILVGGNIDFGRDVINAVKGVIDLDFIAQGNTARNRGFKQFDCVFATPLTGHDVTKRAKNEIGHENVFFIPQVSAGRIAEEIRKFVSKRESRAARMAAASVN